MIAGRQLRLDIRGASHARRMTFALDGFPAGVAVDGEKIAAFMARRAPGRDALSTARRETDDVVWRSGIDSSGVTTGGRVVGEIANRDMRPADYGAARTVPRPGHADFGQWIETGRIPSGGGKNSGRLTAPLCAAGALCLQYLARRGVSVSAQIQSIGRVRGGSEKDFADVVREARDAGDSVGGTVSCRVTGLPPGLGGPLFDGLESGISAALFGIPGVKGVSFGDGCATERMCRMRGSEYNDAFCVRDGLVKSTLRQGGILGGRTYGMPVVFSVALRPTPTVFIEQNSVDLAAMRPAKLAMKGRHDPCIVRRAVPVVEAATAFAVMDALLAREAAHPKICLTLTGATLAEDLAQFRSQRYFADMVELRADMLKKGERAKVVGFPKLLARETPWRVDVLLTFRRECDGGLFAGSERERERFFARSLGGGFDFVDFEEGFGDESLVRRARAAGVRIVRSLHRFDGPVGNLPAKLRALAKEGDVAKVAFMPRNLGDVAKVFKDAARRALPPHVICAMGLQGFATRALAARLGSRWMYASCSPDASNAVGLVTPFELVGDYRFRSTTDRATLFGVTGWPLLRTRSPEINNAAFAAEDEDAVMVPFPAKSAREALAFMKAMDMKGMAVTIPHKRAIMPLLDRVDSFARRVGAVNTVVCEGGKYVGYNTDVEGFSAALAAFAGDLRGKSAALLGDGGAAQAVKVALKELGVKFKVFHRRTPPQGYDILVNATPVDPIPDYAFSGSELVYDLRYVPETTPLMARAAKAGCRTENGFSMLCAQAAAQRRLAGM